MGRGGEAYCYCMVVIKESTKLLSAEEMIKNKVSAIYCVIKSRI